MQVMEPNGRNYSIDITANVLKIEKKSPTHIAHYTHGPIGSVKEKPGLKDGV